MAADPVISVIMPTLNEENNLSRCVQSLAVADERIVVDGGSQDGTRGLARELGCTVMKSPPGRGVQLREGARAATGEILLFLHADCWLSPAAIPQLRIQARKSSRTFGAFGQSIDDPRWRFRCLETGNAVRARWLRLPYGDQALFVDRQTYQEAGEFPQVPLMEDVIFVRRLRRILRPVLLPGPVYVSARRWRQQGVVRQTIKNWLVLAAYQAGISTQRLARWYK